MKPIIKILTTGDLQLNIQQVKCYITDSKGTRRIEDEICLLISGENSESEKIVEEHVTISKTEAIRLATALLAIANS